LKARHLFSSIGDEMSNPTAVQGSHSNQNDRAKGPDHQHRWNRPNAIYERPNAGHELTKSQSPQC
jgi:hypothetical protein